MYKKLNFGMVLFMILSVVGMQAQRVLDEKITFVDTQFPMKPLGSELKGYYFTTSTPYPENNDKIKDFAQQKYQEELKNYPQKVEEYKIKYQQELIQYEKDVEIARENFRIENEEFNKMSKLEKLALSDQKPTLKLPPRPEYRIPYEPYYVEPNVSQSITYDPVVLANTYLTLNGFNVGDKNDKFVLTGSVTVHPFEYMDPQQKVEEQSYFDTNTKKTQIKRTYFYITSYKRPVTLTLYYNGRELYNKIFEPSAKFVELKTTEYPNKFNLEKKTVEDVMLEVNRYINNLYGFSNITTSEIIRYVKNKEQLYNDVDEAKEMAILGYKNFKNGDRNSELFDAIDLWETILKESNMEDKKARIDENISIALMFNVLEASLYLNDFEKVDDYISRMGKIKLNYSEKENLKSITTRKEDREKRMLANK